MAYWILKVILTPLMRVGFRWDIEGRENLPRHGPVIVAANHQSFIDSVVIPFVFRRRVTFVAKAEYFDNPRTAWFFRAMGQIPIQRGSGSAAARAMAAAREVLAAGGVLGIYPEGTRSPDGRIYRGRTGIARLALSTGAVVVPVVLTGTARVQPIDSMRPRLGLPIGVRVGRPMSFAGRGDARADPAVARAVTDEIMDAIAALAGQDRVPTYPRRALREAPTAPGGAVVDLAGADPSLPGPGGFGPPEAADDRNALVETVKHPVHTDGLA